MDSRGDVAALTHATTVHLNIMSSILKFTLMVSLVLVSCGSSKDLELYSDFIAVEEYNMILIDKSSDGDLEFSISNDIGIFPVIYNNLDRTVYYRRPSRDMSLEVKTDSSWLKIPTWYGVAESMPRPIPIYPGSYIQAIGVRFEYTRLDTGT